MSQDFRNSCAFVCHNHPRKEVNFCIKLQHHDDDTPHECEMGHQWAVVQRATPIAISQAQPQPHCTGAPGGERLIELIRERTKLGIEKYGEQLTSHNGRNAMLDAAQESIYLNQYLMQALMESEDEVTRLSEEQIKPLADFLMQQSDVIGHPGDEGACAMAIRIIGELINQD